MKVKELIVLLEKMPKNSRVVFPDWNLGDYQNIASIKKTDLFNSPSRGIIEPYRKNEKENTFKAVIIWNI